MSSANAHILALNSGSSSIKFALFEAARPLRRVLGGAIERIGLSDSTLRVTGLDATDNFTSPVKASDQASAIDALMSFIQEHTRDDSIEAVGHRIVHGGSVYFEPQLFTKEMAENLRHFTIFDPEHLPDEIQLAEAFHKRFPNVPQVACFDTAFHHNMPRIARMLPIPRRYEAKGLRRYGFHGLSYAYLIEELARVAGIETAQGRVILAHLGNGASLAAVHNGKSVDTSMGLTPAAGVPMSTRSGDLDPGLVTYLAHSEKMSAKEFNYMINFESGLLGISETSSDMRDLLEHESEDVRAAEAVAMFCYAVKKRIGAYAAALGGLDALVFSAGIGENVPIVRKQICDGLEFLGIEIDEVRNTSNAELISMDTSRVGVHVIQTDEQLMIAKIVCRILSLIT
ncbi:MAG: acetate/propionate family kinase [Candidatus Kapaibacterium sp.]|jgi:acetate kinase